jgi:hypothetical protein
MDIVEFYVSCNPPLLPKGVALIFASVEERKDDLVSIGNPPRIPLTHPFYFYLGNLRDPLRA